MKVFVTGANGYVGFAVAKAFRERGHRVKGLIRKPENEKLLRAHEIEPVMGNVEETKSYAHALEGCEVFVSCAYGDNAKAVQSDAKTIDAFITAGKKSDFPTTLIYTSGVWVYGNTNGVFVDEFVPLDPVQGREWRPLHEKKVLEATTPQLRTVVIRPGCVYGGKGSLTSLWFESAKSGAVEMVGVGHNHWSMIHVQDLAEAYVLAAEKELSHVVLNVTDGTDYTVKEMVEAVAKICKVPVKELPEKEALERYEDLYYGLIVDQKVSHQRAQRLLGWYPRHQSFIGDIELYYHSISS